MTFSQNTDIIDVGDIVIFKDGIAHDRNPYVFPPIGTEGQVVRICGDGDLIVRWDWGRVYEGGNYCNPRRVSKKREVMTESDELNKFFDEL